MLRASVLHSINILCIPTFFYVKGCRDCSENKNRCICQNRFGWEDGKSPFRTCKGLVIEGFKFCYVSANVNCRDKKPGMIPGTFFSEEACNLVGKHQKIVIKTKIWLVVKHTCCKAV